MLVFFIIITGRCVVTEAEKKTLLSTSEERRTGLAVGSSGCSRHFSRRRKRDVKLLTRGVSVRLEVSWLERPKRTSFNFVRWRGVSARVCEGSDT